MASGSSNERSGSGSAVRGGPAPDPAQLPISKGSGSGSGSKGPGLTQAAVLWPGSRSRPPTHTLPTSVDEEVAEAQLLFRGPRIRVGINMGLVGGAGGGGRGAEAQLLFRGPRIRVGIMSLVGSGPSPNPPNP